MVSSQSYSKYQKEAIIQVIQEIYSPAILVHCVQKGRLDGQPMLARCNLLVSQLLVGHSPVETSKADTHRHAYIL